MPNYDVIVIGSGAGGVTRARSLAPTGKRILILERGDWLKREALNWDAKAVFVDQPICFSGYLVRQQRETFPATGPLLCRRRDQNVRSCSAQYPYPPVSHEPRIQQLFDDLKAAGFHPFSAPCGIGLRTATELGIVLVDFNESAQVGSESKHEKQCPQG